MAIWSLMGQTLGLVVLLGTCKGLTLTRDAIGNVALSRVGTRGTTATHPQIRAADHYPLNGATGIHVGQSFRIAWAINVRQTLIVKPESGELTITCASCLETGSEVRKIRAQDSHQLQIATYNPGQQGGTAGGSYTAAGLGGQLIGYATITPYKDWSVGAHTLHIPKRLFIASSPDGPDSDAISNPDSVHPAHTFTFHIQASCDTLKTETLCTPGDGSRLDCMWTGPGSGCEAEVVVIAGATKLTTSTSAAAPWNRINAGNKASSGIQFVADGVPSEAPLLDCVNGDYTSRGMRNGKPVYSQDWSVPVEHGGSRIQWETDASRLVSGFRSSDGPGWVVVCGGGVRHTAVAEDVHVTAVATWAPVDQWSAGAVTFTQASCEAPSTTGYTFTNAGGDVTRGAFKPTGIVCASGYSGSVVATNCLTTGGTYSVAGCSPTTASATAAAGGSGRRRRRKDKAVNPGKTFNWWHPLRWWTRN